jgi:hypothetical protein
MSDHHPHSLGRKVYMGLGLFLVCVVMYQNFILYSISKSLRKSQSRPTQIELDMSSEEADEVSVALAALAAENLTYRTTLKRQTINLKECMSKLPQNEIDDFYKRHRDELDNKKSK